MSPFCDKFGFSAHYVRTNPLIVSSTFLKVALHAQWRGYGARSPVFSVSFWELFLCAYFVKEKVDKRGAVTIVCGTILKHQDPLAAFLWKKRPKEKLTKEMPSALKPRGSATRRAPLLKKWTKQPIGLCEHSDRQIKI